MITLEQSRVYEPTPVVISFVVLASQARRELFHGKCAPYSLRKIDLRDLYSHIVHSDALHLSSCLAWKIYDNDQLLTHAARWCYKSFKELGVYSVLPGHSDVCTQDPPPSHCLGELRPRVHFPEPTCSFEGSSLIRKPEAQPRGKICAEVHVESHGGAKGVYSVLQIKLRADCSVS